MLDGQLARIKGNSGKYGAFLDSTMDRFADAAIFGGITIWFMRTNHLLAVVSLFCLAAGLSVSYVKARAEGLGLNADVGLIERPERMIIGLTSIGLSGLGIPYVLPIGMWGLAAGTALTLVPADARRLRGRQIPGRRVTRRPNRAPAHGRTHRDRTTSIDGTTHRAVGHRTTRTTRIDRPTSTTHRSVGHRTTRTTSITHRSVGHRTTRTTSITHRVHRTSSNNTTRAGRRARRGTDRGRVMATLRERLSSAAFGAGWRSGLPPPRVSGARPLQLRRRHRLAQAGRRRAGSRGQPAENFPNGPGLLSAASSPTVPTWTKARSCARSPAR